MAQTLNVRLKGLYTYPSELSDNAAGTLSVADNVTIDRDNIVGPRRGFDVLDPTSSAPPAILNRLFTFDDELIGYSASSSAAYYYDPAGWMSLGTGISPPTGTRLRDVYTNKNLYICTSTGVQRISAVGDTFAQTGTPKGLDISTTDAGVSGFLPTTSLVAYRYVLGRKDGHNALILGAVSQRKVHTAVASPSCNVTVTAYIPSGLTTSYFIQLYRTPTYATGTVPGEELQQCYEIQLTSTDITNGYVTMLDIIPDDLLGASLYTSPSQEGIINDNYQPPLCKDIAAFKNHLFFSDITEKHRLYLTLVGCDAVNALGLRQNDTITIAGVVFTAKTSPALSTEFFCDTASVSIATRISNTVNSLSQKVNQYVGGSVYCYQVSNDNDLPGKLLFEERVSGGATFTVNTSRPTAFTPDLTLSGNRNSISKTSPNGLMFSKPMQPESAPLKNILFVGDTSPITRLASLRDSLFIFKDNGEIWTLRGEDETTWSLSLLDNTARLYAPESLAVVNQQIYGLTDRGVVSISETSVSIVSQPIKDKLLDLFREVPTLVQEYGFGIGYEKEGKYILHLPSAIDDAYATQAYVFDVFLDQWTRWTYDQFNPTAGVVISGDLIVAASDQQVYQQLNSNTSGDYFETTKTVSLSSIVDNGDGTYTATPTVVANFAVGDLLTQSTTIVAYVSAVGIDTVTFDAPVQLGAGTLYKAIVTTLEWNPETTGNPAGSKHFQELILLFKRGFTNNLALGFYTDVNPGIETVTLIGSPTGEWGLFDWDDLNWDALPSRQPTRTLVPRGSARATQLIMRLTSQTAKSDWLLNGVSVVYTPTSTRVQR